MALTVYKTMQAGRKKAWSFDVLESMNHSSALTQGILLTIMGSLLTLGLFMVPVSTRAATNAAGVGLFPFNLFMSAEPTATTTAGGSEPAAATTSVTTAKTAAMATTTPSLITAGLVMPMVPTSTIFMDSTEKVPLTVEYLWLSLVQEAGNEAIAERLSTLDTVSTVIASSTKLTADDQKPFWATIKTEQAALHELQAALATSTRSAQARIIVNEVYDRHVLAVVVPRLEILRYLSELQTYFSQLSEVLARARLDLIVDSVQDKDVAKRQKAIAQASKLAEAVENTAADLTIQVSDLKPADYPVISKATLRSASTTIAEMEASLVKINHLLEVK